MMRKCDDEEVKIDNEIIDQMLSWCQDCRFVAAMYVIESININLIKELAVCISGRLSHPNPGPSIEPEPEPTHKLGGCHAYHRS